jgi:hypothetical protein
MFNLVTVLLFSSGLWNLAAAIPNVQRLRIKLWLRHFALTEQNLAQGCVKAVNGLVLFLARALPAVALSLTMYARNSPWSVAMPLAQR